MRTKNRLARVTTPLLLLVLLAGCSTGPAQTSTDTSAEIIAEQTENAAETDKAAEDQATTDEDAAVDGSTERPEGFPADLPLPEGRDPVFFGGGGAYTFSVVTTLDDADAAIDAMVAAGYQEVSIEDTETGVVAQLNNGDWELVASYLNSPDADGLIVFGLTLYTAP